jgi:hypothetical protein
VEIPSEALRFLMGTKTMIRIGCHGLSGLLSDKRTLWVIKAIYIVKDDISNLRNPIE